VRCFLLNFVRAVSMQPLSSAPTTMNFPLHLFGLAPASAPRDSETAHVVARDEVQWDRPVFRAPALPTPRQFASELPFFVNFPSKLRRRP
jgi:hypothetical protein